MSSISIAHSQNEKLWEYNTNSKVFDIDFFGDDKFIYISQPTNEGYHITVRTLLDTALVMEKEIDYWPWKIFISDDKDYFYIYSYYGQFIKYDYQLNRINVISPPQYEFEGSSEEGTANGYCDVDMNRNIAAVKQQQSTVDNRKEFRIVAMDLETGEELGSMKVSSNIEDVQISPDGRYITHPEDKWPAKVRFYDAQTYEHEFDIESRNDDDKDNRLDGYSFSPSGKYIAIEFGASNDRYFLYNLFESKLKYEYTDDNKPTFSSLPKLITDEYFIARKLGSFDLDATIFSLNTIKLILHLPQYFGMQNISYIKPYLITHSGSLLSLARFDPELVSVETVNDTVEVYPQPSSGIFNISLDVSYLNKEYSIYNTAGNIVSEGTITNIDSGIFQLNTPDLPKGVYYFVSGNFRCKIVRGE